MSNIEKAYSGGMDEHKNDPSEQQLLKQQDWDTHNKKTEKAAQAYQDFMADGAGGKKSKKHGKKWLTILLVLVVLVGAGAALYAFVLKGDDTNNEQSSSQTDKPKSTAASESIGSASTEELVAQELGLTLKYPENWQVDDGTTGKVTITSPKVTITAQNGTKTNGKITLTIRAKGQPLTEFEKGNATAVRQSELLKYTKPSPMQRANSYLTFVAYSPAVTGLSGMYITGDYGYQKDQAVPQVDIANIDPVIHVTFNQCNDTNCSVANMPISATSSVWDDKSFSAPIKNMLESITVQ